MVDLVSLVFEPKLEKIMTKPELIILEGAWFDPHETPKVLPYFNALANTNDDIQLKHRTIRNAEDISHYVSRIEEGAQVMLYFACHGKDGKLAPDDEGQYVTESELLDALDQAPDGAISFVHFGCCEMVSKINRRKWHEDILEASGARWCSGYTQSVDWLPSTLLDMALVSEVFVPHRSASDGRSAPLKKKADAFLKSYEQLARSMGFSAFSHVSAGQLLFPSRLNK